MKKNIFFILKKMSSFRESSDDENEEIEEIEVIGENDDKFLILQPNIIVPKKSKKSRIKKKVLKQFTSIQYLKVQIKLRIFMEHLLL